MSEKSIQIVAFNNPYPADFGGAIDMFYKVKALHHLGIKVFLHIFYDKRHDISGIRTYCEEVYLYKRKKGVLNHLSFQPFSVISRKSKKLIERLKATDAPILIESLRSCALLENETFSQKIAVRNHNIEHDYSWGLSKSESSWIGKLAHFVEGYKQKKFERILNKADILFNISKHEQSYFKTNYQSKSMFLNVFQGYESIKSKNGFGKYALYHGDLTTSDNIKSALFLIKVFKKTKIPFIIAGSKLPNAINKLIKDSKNISFAEISEPQQLQELIENAHVNTLYSFQRSGTKLKVFAALFNGRHCILNKNIIDDKNILNVCKVAETGNVYRDAVTAIFKEEFKLTENRKRALAAYNDLKNAKIIIENLL
ncbi:MAG: hypothetical protein EVB11_13230 [Winogradskyella sp.]|nr:MAG: hypothetical protein EVB11_13230 [Winogradskyella sp.]